MHKEKLIESGNDTYELGPVSNDCWEDGFSYCTPVAYKAETPFRGVMVYHISYTAWGESEKKQALENFKLTNQETLTKLKDAGIESIFIFTTGPSRAELLPIGE